MPKKSAGQLGAPEPGFRRIQAKIRLQGADQLPAYVNHLTVNYIDDDFVLTLAHVAVPAFLDAKELGPLTEVKAQVVFRARIPSQKWVPSVNSFHNQIKRLIEQGARIEADSEEAPDGGGND